MENRIAKYINVNGSLMDLEHPRVMGILNVTPDSFYAGSRKQSEEDILQRARQIIDEGGEIIDIGAYSSRPDAQNISTEEEAARLKKALTLLNKEMPEAVISVDTFRADIAKMCVEEHGVAIINDISAGNMDDRMMPVVAKLGVPYVMMHMKGTPQNMTSPKRYRGCETLAQRISSSIRGSVSARHWSITIYLWTSWKSSGYSTFLSWLEYQENQ